MKFFKLLVYLLVTIGLSRQLVAMEDSACQRITSCEQAILEKIEQAIQNGCDVHAMITLTEEGKKVKYYYLELAFKYASSDLACKLIILGAKLTPRAARYTVSADFIKQLQQGLARNCWYDFVIDASTFGMASVIDYFAHNDEQIHDGEFIQKIVKTGMSSLSLSSICLLVDKGAVITADCLTDIDWKIVDSSVIEFVLENGALTDPISKTEGCYTPLQCAIIACRADCVMLLLKQGANLKVKAGVDKRETAVELARAKLTSTKMSFDVARSQDRALFAAQLEQLETILNLLGEKKKQSRRSGFFRGISASAWSN